MGYRHRVFTLKCRLCDSELFFNSTGSASQTIDLPWQWLCQKCKTRHYFAKALDEWPNVPRTPLYVGAAKTLQLKLHPVPPDFPNETWASPYSIRSFVYQASRQFGGCGYRTESRGHVMGEEIFSDKCYEPDKLYWGTEEGPSCHILAGWTLGQSTCPLWEKISQLCQTDVERRFLHSYLALVKDRQFPMLIPQVRIGIAERRRPDFVMFVPLQFWKYEWCTIQLDESHSPESAEDDEIRDREITEHGYKVLRFRPERHGYPKEVKSLVERIEHVMRKAEEDPRSVAIEVPRDSIYTE